MVEIRYGRWMVSLLAAVVGTLLIVCDVAAREDLRRERAIAEVMRTLNDDEAKDRTSKSWAILPQVGFSPDQGVNAGIKFTDRNLFNRGLTLDLDGVVAMEGQQDYKGMLVHPDLAGGRLLTVVEAGFFSDPTEEFFGLGSNRLGPDPISTHKLRSTGGSVTLAWRLRKELALAFGVGYRNVEVSRGKASKDPPVPFTPDLFPNLTGIEGGNTLPLSFSLILNNRKDITRPTRGWSVVASIQHVDKSLGSDFQFTRYSFQASYLFPLLTRRQVLGLRGGGTYVDGDIEEIPFYELPFLGGDESLRGFFKYRFIGRSAALATAEYRLNLLDFQFLRLWRVRIDGVGFVEGGRVFISNDDLANQLGPEFIETLKGKIRFSYGAGLRIALGQAILARIDAGFSEEEDTLLYLTFGHTF